MSIGLKPGVPYNQVLMNTRYRRVKVPKRLPVKQRPVIKGKVKLVDKRLSTCIMCHKGVFEETDYLWEGASGYIHKGCKVNESQIAS